MHTTKLLPNQGKRLKKLRANAGLTQTQAGILVHVPSTTWQQWETERRGMPQGLMELAQLKLGIVGEVIW